MTKQAVLFSLAVFSAATATAQVWELDAAREMMWDGERIAALGGGEAGGMLAGSAH